MKNTNDENRTILENFIYIYLSRIARDNDWGDRYLKDTQAKLKVFCQYNGLGKRPIKTISVHEIEDFLEWLATYGNTRMRTGLSNSTKN